MLWGCYQTQIHVPNAHWCQTNQNIRVWSRESFIAGSSRENGWLVLKRPKLPDGLRGHVFIGKIWGEGYRVCDFLLIVWCWGNWAVFQESCAQAEVTILHLGWGLSSSRRTQRYCYVYSLRRNQDPARRLHYYFLTAPPLFLHSLLSEISNCLNLPFGTQGKSRRLNEADFLKKN